jgi:hypothetical protein
MPPEKPFWTFREIIGGIVALTIVFSICWSALWDQSQSSQTAIVGGLGAVTAFLFRGSMPQNGNGNGYTNGSSPTAGTPPVP